MQTEHINDYLRPSHRHQGIAIDGSTLRNLRLQHTPRLSQEDLGGLIGRSRGHISRIESENGYKVSLEVVDDLARALGVTAEELYLRETMPGLVGRPSIDDLFDTIKRLETKVDNLTSEVNRLTTIIEKSKNSII